MVSPVIVLIFPQSARSPPSFDIRLHSSSSIPVVSFVEPLFIKTFCHRKYLNSGIVHSSGPHGTFNLAVITNRRSTDLGGCYPPQAFGFGW